MKDDLISRQGAINKCRKRLYESAVNNVGYKCDADKVFVDIAENHIETWLNELPYAWPEQPERKKGEWIDYTEDGFVECPFCHSATTCDGNKDELRFCFLCGAELR